MLLHDGIVMCLRDIDPLDHSPDDGSLDVMQRVYRSCVIRRPKL